MSSAWGGGDGGVRITIGGTAEQLVAAAQQGGFALQDLAASYKIAAEQMNLVAEATRMLGAEQGQLFAALLRGADETEAYDVTLDALRASLQAAGAQASLFAAQQAETNASMAEFHGVTTRLTAMGGPMGAFGSLLQTFGEPLMGLVNGTESFGSVAQDVAMGGLGLLSGGIGAAADAAGQFLTQMWAMTAGMVMFQAFGAAAQEVQQLAAEMVNLNETMQNQDVGWAYLFGGPGNGPGGGSGPNYGAASQLMGWTAVQSYNAPFTRQDINQAISTLQTVGLDQAGIERYIPVLEDLAVRNPGLSLAQIAQSVMGAEFGYTRMLRYDLRIAPQELEKYGLNMSDGTRIDPATLLPALLNYAKDQGYYSPAGPGGQDQGAAYMLAHNTFTGAFTSWQDRYQNFLLQLGGTYWGDPNQTASGMVRNPLAGEKGQAEYIYRKQMQAGDIMQGSLFDDMITGLNAITNWWDRHQQEMDQIADLFSQGIGQGLKDAGEAVTAFARGLQQSGLGDQVLQGVRNAIAWLADPNNQRQIALLAQEIGDTLGVTIKYLADDFGTVKDAFNQFLDTLDNGSGFTLLGEIADYFAALVYEAANLVTELTFAGKLLYDFGKLTVDIASGNWGQLGADGDKFMQDLNDFNTAEQQLAQNFQNTVDQINSITTRMQEAATLSQNGGVPEDTNGSVPRGGERTRTAAPPARPAGHGPQTDSASVSWGDTNITNYIYGASGSTVQAIVDQGQKRQATNAALVAQRPGVGRFRMVGLVY